MNKKVEESTINSLKKIVRKLIDDQISENQHCEDHELEELIFQDDIVELYFEQDAIDTHSLRDIQHDAINDFIFSRNMLNGLPSIDKFEDDMQEENTIFKRRP